MRCSLLALAGLLIVGCGTTQFVERNLDHAGISEVRQLCWDDCSVQVSYHEEYDQDNTRSGDSLFARLRTKNVSIRLADSRIVEGRMGVIRPGNDQWLIYRRDKRGGLIDTVHFWPSSIKNLSVREDLQGTEFRSSRDTLHVDAAHALSLSSVQEMSVMQRRHRVGPRVVATVLGAVVGGTLGALAGRGKGDTCRSRCEGFDCIGKIEVCPSVTAITVPVGVLLGGGMGFFLADVLGTVKTTVYRFRADTPRQMSVVIGVGPRVMSTFRCSDYRL